MKALNRAIARTVSQLGRYGREGCHPPMLFALEQHLDALLTMERKQLELAGVKVAHALPPFPQGFDAGRTPSRVQTDEIGPHLVHQQPHANDNVQPTPDVIDMTDSRNWQVGDTVLRVAPSSGIFDPGHRYAVTANDDVHVSIRSPSGGTLKFRHDGGPTIAATVAFTWAASGKAEA